MSTPLPSKDMVLQACAGTVAIQHPILQAAYELASLHEAQLEVDTDLSAIERERARLVRQIDGWIATAMPPAHDAAYLHTETVGMVIDRLARFSVGASVVPEHQTPRPQLRCARQRLTELAIAYGDLCLQIQTGTRRLPDFSFPRAEGDSAQM